MKKVTEMKQRQIHMTPEREELNMKLQLLVNRLSGFANFHIANQEILGPLSSQTFAQMVVTNAQFEEFVVLLSEKLMAFSEKIQEIAVSLEEIEPMAAKRYGDAAKALQTGQDELFSRVIPNLERYIDNLQKNLNITITQEGVRSNAAAKEEPPTSQPGTADAKNPV